jgi:uncharacterized protein (TIGR02246 family)
MIGWTPETVEGNLLLPDFAEDELRHLVQVYQDAFNTNDAAGMSKLFTEDTTFVNYSGRIIRGRALLHRAQEAVFPWAGR